VVTLLSGRTLTLQNLQLTNGGGLGGLPRHVADPDPNIYWSDNYVTLDFETTTEFKGSSLVKGNRIILACWRTGPEGPIKHSFGSEYEQSELLQDISNAQFVVAHNAKFELGWLRRCGVDLHKCVVFDTLLAEYVLGGNKYFLQQLSLKECLARRGMQSKEDLVGRLIRGGCPVEDIPQSWLLKYCERDVEATHELFISMRDELLYAEQEHLLYQRCLVTPALVDIEFNGLQLDTEIIHDYLENIEDRHARSLSELEELCDGASPTSPKQLSDFVYNRLNFKIPTDYKGYPLLTSTGNGSVAVDAMDRLRPTTNRQREFLDKYREWKALNTAVTKYLRKFGECCRENSGRLLGVFNQCNTRTHRLSSSGLVYKIQFQNLDRSYKPFFRARKAEWLVGEIDGTQLEFRIAVHMGRDRVGLKNIRTKGFDVHTLTASTLGIDRQNAKEFTFKPLYGGTGGTNEQKAYFRAFKNTYQGIAETQRRWVLKTLNNKQFTTEYGLTFYFPGTVLKASGWITNTTNIYNYPVQGFATAEIIPISLVCAWHRMKDWESFLVNTVHDSIIAELLLAKQCFITDTYEVLRKLYGISLTVPLGVGVLVGSHWSNEEAKDNETKYEAEEFLWLKAAISEGMVDESG